MKRLQIGAVALLAAVVLVLVLVSSVSADSSKPTLVLKASPTKCKVNTMVTFTVTVQSKKPAYEVRVYKNAGSAWTQVATASQVADGRYTGYAKASPKGKVKFRAGYVDSKGKVTAYSQLVTVTVTK
jgi:hypothetical protein